MDLKELDEPYLKKIISFIGADANFQECNDLFDTATQLLTRIAEISGACSRAG